MKTFIKDKLTVNIYPDRTIMGQAAAKDISDKIKALLKTKKQINMIFAAAPSQRDVLAALVADDTIEWDRINAFHMDEYVGLEPTAPQNFGNFLKTHIFDKVPFASVNLIASTGDPEAECQRYAKLLEDNPTDIILMGIGENGHIAFNDPWVADFNDTKKVKVVALDEVCRNQQVNDGCFEAISQVPTHAITLTVPVFADTPNLFCVVPAPTKAKAVEATVNGPVGEHCPATILRRVTSTLYLDNESSVLL
ncbi:MAG: glucosamine-6-phosphate deaminase [Clostridia bacterium]|nr:glucosamine-6-phosphate deaminase [Clostridia bacterium]